MKTVYLTIVLTLFGSSCVSNKYGYTRHEWDKLTKEQKDEIKQDITRTQEQQYYKMLRNKENNYIFDSRSNRY